MIIKTVLFFIIMVYGKYVSVQELIIDEYEIEGIKVHHLVYVKNGKKVFESLEDIKLLQSLEACRSQLKAQ